MTDLNLKVGDLVKFRNGRFTVITALVEFFNKKHVKTMSNEFINLDGFAFETKKNCGIDIVENYGPSSNQMLDFYCLEDKVFVQPVNYDCNT